MIEWRILDWLPNYEVSEFGDLRRRFGAGGHRAGKILRPQSGRKGYLQYGIYCGGKQRLVKASRLVCEAWHGPPPSPQHQAAHNDGDKLNNHWSNLRWATRSENERDKLAHGTTTSRLTWPLAREIRARFTGAYGEQSALAREYGLSHGTVHFLLNGRTWREEAQC